jgi:hypothetical protein
VPSLFRPPKFDSSSAGHFLRWSAHDVRSLTIWQQNHAANLQWKQNLMNRKTKMNSFIRKLIIVIVAAGWYCQLKRIIND